MANGELDLSGWDFQKQGALSLDGEWLFRWRDSDPEYASVSYSATDWELFPVPAYWNSFTGNSIGYGWFRVKLNNVPAGKLSLSVGAIPSAYKLYANGKLILNCGNPAESRQESKPFRIPLKTELPGDSSITLAWYIANFHDIFGGPCYSPVIGRVDDLMKQEQQKQAVDAFVLGIISIMGLYHGLLWLLRRKERASLYFSMLCLAIILRTIVVGYYLRDFLPFLNLHEWRFKPDYLSLPVIWFFLRNFYYQLFPREFYRPVYFFFLGCAILYALVVIITPSWIYMNLLYPYWTVIILMGIWLMIVLIRAVYHKRKGALLMVIAQLVFFLAVINDIIHSYAPFYFYWLLHAAMVFIIAAQSTILSIRFTATFRTAEHLSRNLQREVDRQTNTISGQNRKLKKLNKEKTLFFINLAHELKTPLTLINNYLEKYIQTKGVNNDASILRENFHKLKSDLVNFLDHEKLKRGQIMYDHSTVIDLSEYLEKKILLFKEAARDKELTLELCIEENGYIKMDPSALDRVVNNLLDNAVKYTNPGDRIQVILGGDPESIRLAVEDTGIGIPLDRQANIFRPYFQASHQKANYQGMGMGLNIVHRIMQNIGGKIELISGEQKGTRVVLTFTRCLPEWETGIPGIAVPQSPVIPVKQMVLPKTVHDPGRNTLLIVEDNFEMLCYLQISLSAEYNVYGARDGQEALNQLLTIPRPDLIIADIMMDQMDGYEFRRRITQMEKYFSLPFIFLSAKSAPEEIINGLASGAVDYISKPFDLPELQAKIRSHLQLQSAQQNYNRSELEQQLLDVIRKPRQKESDNFQKKCDLFRLSLREQEILQLIFQARESKEIGRILNISYPTVRTHIKHIFEKCGVISKVELIKLFKEF